jgi:hypothetical protein
LRIKEQETRLTLHVHDDDGGYDDDDDDDDNDDDGFLLLLPGKCSASPAELHIRLMKTLEVINIPTLNVTRVLL